MRSIAGIVAAVLTLVSTHATANIDLTPERDEPTVQITVVWYQDKGDVIRICKRFGAWPDNSIESVRRHPAPGCNLYWPSRKTCEIHTLKPQRVDDARTLTLGHEALHCFIGGYHD